MRMLLRRLCPAAVLLAAALLAAAPAAAQPEAVRIVVPAPPGGSLDATARVLAQRMTALTGEPHVVENKPGANTQIGNDYVARSAPDGRTLLYAGLSLVVNPLLYKSAAHNLAELRPVIAVSREPYSLVASSALKLPSVRELGRVIAARQGGLNCAAPPGVMLLGCEQLRRKYPNVNVIPYPGIAPALGALAGGHVDVAFVPLETAARVVQGRQAEIVATADTHTLPGVPTIGTVWPEFLMESFQGVLVPTATPDARVRQLNEQLARVLAEPDTQERLRAIGHDPLKPGSPEDYARLLADLLKRYGAVIDKLGLAAR